MSDFIKDLFGGSGDIRDHSPDTGGWEFPNVNFDDSGIFWNSADNPVNLGQGVIDSGSLWYDTTIGTTNKCIILKAATAPGTPDVFAEMIVDCDPNIVRGDVLAIFRAIPMNPGDAWDASALNCVGGGMNFNLVDTPKVRAFAANDGSFGSFDTFAPDSYPGRHTFTIRVELVGDALMLYVDSVLIDTQSVLSIGGAGLDGAGDTYFIVRFNTATDHAGDYFDMPVLSVRAGTMPEGPADPVWTNFVLTHEVDA